ncbi:hypothetical protein G6O69_23770 [Pseudenhygromyxa sp. WMMC2535]|uniref:hypothetical protein n=1 Tax=Pseudenhygromyxa sp. WMMC2535 TaxID=2712867 RepID=UPI0015562632|nr:hypothetical protein [Pseudenhygromyxa sp. WMMC2535]NVB40878.1 hypothetical protein [Pseudenhygromyxa sp. WMMC2535]
MSEAPSKTQSVALSPVPQAPPGPPAPALLAEGGPEVVLGGGADPLVPMIAPTRSSLFGPRGATLLAPEGPLVVADTGHHRLLGWTRRPSSEGAPADWILGQPDAFTEGRNGGDDGDARADTLNVPTGVARYGDAGAGAIGLVVADGWNHRVLIWHRVPTSDNTPADLVLGQADFRGSQPNRGGEVSAATMHWPFGVLVHDGRLIVADTGNRRVLIWNSLPEANGQPADLVLGQADMAARSDNGGGDPDARSMRWPHDLAICQGDLVVTDAGNNRVMRWSGIPERSYAPAERILGQVDAAHIDHNQASYWPRADTLNMPYAIAASGDTLLIGDTANSRLLGWRSGEAEAAQLTGQAHFRAKGDNRWGVPTRDSLCWPYGLDVCGDVAVVSDTGNHRVLLWRIASRCDGR